MVFNSSKTEQKEGSAGCCHSKTSDDILVHQNGCQNIICWCPVWSSKRFGRHLCRNRYFFLNLIHKNFVWNLTSKLARSTLTLCSTISIKNRSKCIAAHYMYVIGTLKTLKPRVLQCTYILCVARYVHMPVIAACQRQGWKGSGGKCDLSTGVVEGGGGVWDLAMTHPPLGICTSEVTSLSLLKRQKSRTLSPERHSNFQKIRSRGLERKGNIQKSGRHGN